MKIVIISYAIVTTLLILYIALIMIKVIKEFMTEHPTAKFKKISFVERMIEYIRAGVLIFCPILNVVVLFLLLANYEELEEEMYNTLYEIAIY